MPDSRDQAESSRAAEFLPGGELGALIRLHDWSATPLGPLEQWPAGLRAITALVLGSPLAMIILWGRDLVQIYNDEYAAIMGDKHPAGLGQRTRDCWPEVWDFNAPIYEAVFRGESRSFQGQRLALHRNGRAQDAWFDLTYSPLRHEDGDGSVGGVLVTVVETTERVRAEQRRAFLARLTDALRDLADPHSITATASELLGVHLETGRVGYGEVDPTGEIVSVERDWTRGDMASLAGETRIIEAFGPSVAAEVRNGRTLVVEDCRTDPRTADPAHLAAWESIGTRALMVVPLVRDGRLVAIHYAHSAEPRRWSDLDISLAEEVARRTWATIERARAEAALRQMNATLEAQVAQRTAELRLHRDIIESHPAPICAFDTDLRLTVFNRAQSNEFLRIFGHRQERGDFLPGLLPPKQAGQVQDCMQRALAGEVFTIAGRFGAPDAAETHWELTYAPLRDDDGRVVGGFHHAREITDRVRAEARLGEAQEALRQAQKMEAVGQLTGGIAHDFNNLLGAVVGAFDLIRRKPSDQERVTRFAEAGLEAAERGARLTGQLLAFSRSQKIDLKSVVISDLVKNMRDLLQRTLGPMIRLRIDIDRARVPVLTDPTQLELAILNLAINARDAMPDGGRLTICTETRLMETDAELASGEYVELAVADTGTGMAPDIAARALDPFFTTKGVGKGTGLGLSQVYGIARQSGGTVRIESRVGTGTTIRIYLPRTERPIAAEDAVEFAEPAAPSRTATVLLVDDDPDVRDMIAASLDTLGYRVLEAPDGRSGLAALQEHAPDLLLVDFAMPEMNGAAVARAARDLRPDLPIVFATGYAETALIEAAVGKEVPLLRKPFRIEELRAVLAEALAPGAG